MLAEITTYVEQVKERLLTQYKEMRLLRALIEATLVSVQSAESAAWDVLQQTSIGSLAGFPMSNTITSPRATGVWLERLASVVGADLSIWSGQSASQDGERAKNIYARIFSNRSSGTIEELIRIAQLMTGSQVNTLTEYFPAAVVIDLADEAGTSMLTFRLLAEMRRARSAGIGLFVIGSPFPYSESFTFSETDAEVADTARGWGDDYNDPDLDTIGGLLVFAEQA